MPATSSRLRYTSPLSLSSLAEKNGGSNDNNKQHLPSTHPQRQRNISSPTLPNPPLSPSNLNHSNSSTQWSRRKLFARTSIFFPEPAMSDGQARLTRLAGWQFTDLAAQVIQEVESRGGEAADIGRALTGGVARAMVASMELARERDSCVSEVPSESSQTTTSSTASIGGSSGAAPSTLTTSTSDSRTSTITSAAESFISSPPPRPTPIGQSPDAISAAAKMKLLPLDRLNQLATDVEAEAYRRYPDLTLTSPKQKQDPKTSRPSWRDSKFWFPKPHPHHNRRPLPPTPTQTQTQTPDTPPPTTFYRMSRHFHRKSTLPPPDPSTHSDTSSSSSDTRRTHTATMLAALDTSSFWTLYTDCIDELARRTLSNPPTSPTTPFTTLCTTDLKALNTLIETEAVKRRRQSDDRKKRGGGGGGVMWDTVIGEDETASMLDGVSGGGWGKRGSGDTCISTSSSIATVATVETLRSVPFTIGLGGGRIDIGALEFARDVGVECGVESDTAAASIPLGGEGVVAPSAELGLERDETTCKDLVPPPRISSKSPPASPLLTPSIPTSVPIPESTPESTPPPSNSKPEAELEVKPRNPTQIPFPLPQLTPLPSTKISSLASTLATEVRRRQNGGRVHSKKSPKQDAKSVGDTIDEGKGEEAGQAMVDVQSIDDKTLHGVAGVVAAEARRRGMC